MAERGIIEFIIGVAGAGFRLSLVLNAASCEVANAGLEVHAISRGVSLFSLTLKQLGTVLQQKGSVHSQEVLEAAKQVGEECKVVFDEIERMLDKVRSRRPDGSLPIQQKFQWAFKRGRVTYLLGQLESLKLNLSLMLQVLQLGKLMASTSKSDSQEEVTMKMNQILQERAETQNIIIVRYWQIQELDLLFEEAKREAAEETQSDMDQKKQALITNGQLETEPQSNGTPQLLVDPPTDLSMTNVFVKLPVHSLGELDQILHRIRQSPRDMIQVSNEVIDPLLENWTCWNDIREQRHARDSTGSSKYTPSVQDLYEEDEAKARTTSSQDRDESPRGYYLEGNTTDWRKPNSAAARSEAARLRKRYSGYQPSVSADSSEIDDSPGSKGSKKRSPQQHIIDSSTESSGSDLESPRRHRRQSSDGPKIEKRTRFPDGPPLGYSQSAGQPPMGNRPNPTPGTTTLHPPTSRGSISNTHPVMPARPLTNPSQIPLQHSISSPLPPINTTNAPNPYAPPNIPYSPEMTRQTLPQYQPSNGPASAYSRYAPQQLPPLNSRIPLPPRPGSQDGKTRSPSRLSSQYSSYNSPYGLTAPPRGQYFDERDREREYRESKRASREKTKKNLREGATKGILGAGAMAAFLEALEGFAI